MLDTDKRTISIEDNATGICAADFEKTLADIANSDKKLGEDKGFRGIGRLCGLAYCKELVFTSTAEGENIISIMRCDAIKMRELITASEDGKKYTASEVLSSIYKFDSKNTGDKESHWFKVEMIGINDENTDLLDFTQIKEYLSFVAPVPYQNTFLFRAEVYKHAKEIGCNIDEYNIFLNGEQIFKKYKTMPETFIIYRRKYDKKLRERLADRYKNHSSEDCDLANEWWTKFCSLPAEKLEIAKSIISLNKFKEGDYDCTDKEILDVLSYYSITRDIAEQSI